MHGEERFFTKKGYVKKGTHIATSGNSYDSKFNKRIGW